MDAVGLLAGTGWASGINLYAVTFLLGLAGRLGWEDVPDVLSRTDVMVVAALLFVVEFGADKVPYLDNLWDAAHTIIRPLGAAALGYVLGGEAGSIGEAAGAILSGALALSAHGAKATTRAAVNTSPEPVSNVVLSLLEDVGVVLVVLLAVWIPVLAIGVVVVGVVGGGWLVLRLWRALGRLLRRGSIKAGRRRSGR